MGEHDPYAAPKEASAPPPAGAVVLSWKLDEPLPQLCLKCATEEDVLVRHERFAIGAPSTATGALSGILGAVVAQQARRDKALLLPLVGVVLGAVLVVAWIGKSRTKYAELDVPLCKVHDAEWAEGVVLRRNVMIFLLGGAVGAIVGWALDVPFLLGTGIAAFLGSIILAVTAKLQRRFVAILAVSDGVGSMTGVSVEAIEAIEARGRPKRRRRKKKDADA